MSIVNQPDTRGEFAVWIAVKFHEKFQASESCIVAVALSWLPHGQDYRHFKWLFGLFTARLHCGRLIEMMSSVTSMNIIALLLEMRTQITEN